MCDGVIVLIEDVALVGMMDNDVDDVATLLVDEIQPEATTMKINRPSHCEGFCFLISSSENKLAFGLRN